MNKYEVKIVDALLKKYYKRKAIHKDNEVHRRIDLQVIKILKNYSNYNVELTEKENVNKAIDSLIEKGFITASRLKYSEDYEKIFLVEDNITALEDYAARELGIMPRSFVVEELTPMIEGFKGKNKISDFYITDLENRILNRSIQIDSIRETDILKTLSFLEQNENFLYIREASMLIFGDSKHLENNVKTPVNSILSNYFVKNGEEVFEDENLFERFNIYDTDQDICIKGTALIDIGKKKIDIEGLTGGVSFSIKDIGKLDTILVNCDKVMTVENKTSFLRMNGNCCYIYLGGFATKSQIMFIKKMINDNPNKEYLHFGDIDAGGFWIHKKLCEQVGRDFKLFHMSKGDLINPTYEKCLKKLTDSDINRLKSLKAEKAYIECVNYMIDNSVKLEQEIISLDISCDGLSFRK